jgi:hypothetical protein
MRNQVEMIATKRMRYGRALLSPGMSFSASREDAAVLVAVAHARKAPPPQPAELPPADTSVKKTPLAAKKAPAATGYWRRDMVAAPAGAPTAPKATPAAKAKPDAAASTAVGALSTDSALAKVPRKSA